VGEPALLDLTRAALIPAVPDLTEDPGPPPVETPAETEEPPPMTLAELEAALAAAETEEEEEEEPEEEKPAAQPPPASEGETIHSYFGDALTEEQVVFDRARTSIEDLALLGSMRRPLPDQGWMGRAEPERRLLARVDAIAACGEEVLPKLVSLLEGRPVPDPELTWALVFLFGSIAGDDSAEQAMGFARTAPLAEDGMLEAIADALALAPNPSLSPLVLEWLSDPAPERHAAAALALSRRLALTTAQALSAATSADPRVAAAGAGALATSTGPVDPAALWKLAHHADEAVVRAALESALIRRSPIAARRAAELLREGRPDHAGAATLVALTSGPDSLEILLGASASGSACAIEALGWYGHPDAIEPLLERLEGDMAIPAVEALQLLTGASITEADPEPEYEEGKGPFTAGEGPVPAPEILSAKPEPWREWWEAPRSRRTPRCPLSLRTSLEPRGRAAPDRSAPRRSPHPAACLPGAVRAVGVEPALRRAGVHRGAEAPDRRLVHGARVEAVAGLLRPAGASVNPPPLSKATTATVELLPQLAASGEAILVTVIKQRFQLTPKGQPERVPGAKVNVADLPWDEDAPETSSSKLPSDLCLFKPSTDVIVAGSALAKGGARVRELDVGLRVGPIKKVLRVFGPRVWYRGLTGIVLSDPEPFAELPLRWEYAWGGRDESDPKKPLEESRNPVGRGVARDPATLLQKPGPAIEDVAHLVSTSRSSPPPAGVGPIGRHWLPRKKFAGTYDEAWKKTRMPLPPADLDPRFEQAAPPDQIAPAYLRGGEPVGMHNLCAEGPLVFELPRLAFFVGGRLDGKLVEHRTAMDTLVLFPGEKAFEMTWRATVPVPRAVHRLEEIQVHERKVL
jgi:hypothetical protein